MSEIMKSYFKNLISLFSLIILLNHIKLGILETTEAWLMLCSPPLFTQVHPIPPWWAQQLIRGFLPLPSVCWCWPGLSASGFFWGRTQENSQISVLELSGVKVVASSSSCFSDQLGVCFPHWGCSARPELGKLQCEGKVPSVCFEHGRCGVLEGLGLSEEGNESYSSFLLLLCVGCSLFYLEGSLLAKVLFVQLLLIPLLSCSEVPGFRALCFIGGLDAEGAQTMTLFQLRLTGQAQLLNHSAWLDAMDLLTAALWRKLPELASFIKQFSKGSSFFFCSWNVLHEGVYFKDVLTENFGKECLFWLLICLRWFFSVFQ